MHRKLFLVAGFGLIFVATRCMPASAQDGIPGIGETASPTSTTTANSGIRGTTHFSVVSGVPGGTTTGEPASLEFAIAPVEAGKPVYQRAIFVKSNAEGLFQVEVPPGTYWIGPKAKALDPVKYAGSAEFSEVVVEVKAGMFASVELVVTGYAP